MSEQKARSYKKKKRNLLDIQADLMRKGEFINEVVTVTHSENIFGQAMLDKGLKLIPNFRMNNFSYDFKIFHYPILIEVDGGVHKNYKIRLKDYQKERWAQKNGYYIIRFMNEEIGQNLDSCVQEVETMIRKSGQQAREIWVYELSIGEQIKKWYKKLRKKDGKEGNR